MGKRIEDLHLDDTIIEHTVESAEARRERFDSEVGDERDTPWYQFVSRIDDLLATGEYDWAIDTLGGIRTTVETSRRVTDGQTRAVANIQARGELRREDGFRRRYEGFRGRQR